MGSLDHPTSRAPGDIFSASTVKLLSLALPTEVFLTAQINIIIVKAAGPTALADRIHDVPVRTAGPRRRETECSVRLWAALRLWLSASLPF
jgi:hypothetical protein